MVDTDVKDTCAAMRISSGEWVKVSCSEDTEHGVVCEAADSKGHFNISVQTMLASTERVS